MTDALLFPGDHREAVIALLQGGLTGDEMLRLRPSTPKLSHELAREIRSRVRMGERQKRLAVIYGVHESAISKVINYQIYREIYRRAD